jgi:2,4-dichlorophenol 6-monooxygenase
VSRWGLGRITTTSWGEWTSSRDIGDKGYILVRPDRFIAWRAKDVVSDPAAALRDVMIQILGQSRVASPIVAEVEA